MHERPGNLGGCTGAFERSLDMAKVQEPAQVGKGDVSRADGAGWPIRGTAGARCKTCGADISALPTVGILAGVPAVFALFWCDAHQLDREADAAAPGRP